MVVFAMHVVGNSTTQGDQLRARCDGQHPATGHCQTLHVSQQNPRFAGHESGGIIKCHEPVQTLRGPQHPIRVEAHIAVAATIAKSQALNRPVCGQHLCIVQGL